MVSFMQNESQLKSPGAMVDLTGLEACPQSVRHATIALHGMACVILHAVRFISSE